MTENPPLSTYTRRCQTTTTADITNWAEEPLHWRTDQPADSMCLLGKAQVCTRGIIALATVSRFILVRQGKQKGFSEARV